MYFEDFKLNDVIEIAPAIIEKSKMLQFAKEYDNVPLHTDEQYAKSTRFGGLIAPGIMSYLAVWAKYLEVDLFGDELIAGKSTKIEWFKPVYADETLFSKAEVTKLIERNAKNGLVELSIFAYNGKGELVLTGINEVIVKRKLN